MGVLGLWQLLAPVGQPVTLESLENKIFAVDISIWLNQAVKGYRDSEGGSVPNAHLFSLFSRLCKLLFYKIRPIIVFDGGFPELKRQTIINRQQRRAAVKQNSREVGLKILTNYLASQQLGQTGDLPSSGKVTFKRKEKVRDEIYALPPLPESSQSFLSNSCETNEEKERKFSNFSREDIKYLNKIDIESDDFNNLPPAVKQEILSTLKESRRHRTWDQFEELPKESNDFSSYQMQCLLKKRKLQSKLEEVQKDLRNMHSSAYVSQYTNDHVIGETNKIMSDDTSYYVLLKKIIDKKESESDKKSDVKPSISAMADTKSAFIRDIENIDADGSSNDDMEIAIMNSLSDVKKEENFLDVSDEEYDVDNPKKILDKKESESDKKFEDVKSSISVVSDTKSAFVRDIENIDADESSNDDVKIAIMNSLSDVGKKEECFLDVSDEEYDIDNPPTRTVERKNSPLNLSDEKYNINFPSMNAVEAKGNSLNLSEENIKSVSEIKFVNKNEKICFTETDHKSTPSQNSVLTSPKSSAKKDEKGNVSVGSVDNEDEPDIMILPEENLDARRIFNKSVVVSSDDEMISCEEENTEKLDESIRKDVIKEAERSNKKIDTLSSEVNSSTHEELSILNKHSSEKSLVFDNDLSNNSFEVSSYDEPSTSTKRQDFDSPTSSDKNLQESNLELQRDLETAAAILEAEQTKQDRQANTVQDHMIQECKELLQLFGIPYIVSPLEAEAQCAFYDKVNLTHGTITDDSDVWLFGGTRVYKNFFTQQKFVESYKDKEIFTHFGLSRLKLINFALLTGSDYTEGIEGVGPVTAMEIISEFPGEGIDALQKFKDWWDESNKHTRTPENKVRAKFKKFVLAHNFPDEKVFDAYLNPEVDSSTEKFTWGRPDLDAIREYARERFGWNQSKVDNALLPVLKKLNERNSQTHIDNFFTVTLKKSDNLFPSKRIMSALKKITSPEKGNSSSGPSVEKTVKRKTRTSAKKAVPRKITKKVTSTRGRKRNIQSLGPALSESSSDSD